MSYIRVSSVVSTLSVAFLSAQAAFAAAPLNVAPSSELPPPVSTNDPAPTAPSPVVGREVALVKQAGRGSPTGYARAGVLELGGGLNFSKTPDFLQSGVTPTFGWFLADNFQLSFIGSVLYNHTDVSVAGAKGTVNGKDAVQPGTEKPISVAMLIQPSWHLPLRDVLFIYGGLGVGAAFQKPNAGSRGNHGWGFAFAPEVGFNFLVGRSGIISPSVNVLFATTDLEKAEGDNKVKVGINTNVGCNVRYSLMF